MNKWYIVSFKFGTFDEFITIRLCSRDFHTAIDHAKACCDMHWEEIEEMKCILDKNQEAN